MEKASQGSVRSFGVPLWQVAANFSVGALASVFCIFALTPFAVLAAVALLLSALHLALSRVTLTDAALIISSGLGRKEYSRKCVSDARWTYGAPVEVQIADVGWIRLPYLGQYPTELSVSLRYWIHGNGRVEA